MTRRTRFVRLFSLLIATLGLFILFGITFELFGDTAIRVLSGVFSVVLSGLLVVLYWQQKEVLERQGRIMEAEHLPMLSYDDCEFMVKDIQTTFGENKDIAHEAAKFDAYNYGRGRALKIRTEIVVGTGISTSESVEVRNQKISMMVEQVDSPRTTNRVERKLETPHDSLGSKESGTLIGLPYFHFLPTGEYHGSFQNLQAHNIEKGEYVTAIMVVKYQDILGNSYLDIPYGHIFQYVPETPIHDFPVASEEVKNPKYAEFWNIEYENDYFGSKTESGHVVAVQLTEDVEPVER